MNNTTKGNYWILVLFEDNIEKNPNWKEKLINSHLRFCISPYHNKDIWTEADIIEHPEREEYIKEHLGEPKKPHYHVLIHCDQNTTFSTMKEITQEMNLPIPLVCRSPYGMYHYFTHEFNPDKAQYDPNEIRHFNGSDPSDYLMEISKLEAMNIKQILAEKFVELKLKKFYQMQRVAASYDNPKYLHIFQNNVTYFKQILVDNYQDAKEEMTKIR